jgi:hypothetical protein
MPKEEKLYKLFEHEENYYYNSYINGNKSHVVEETQKFAGTIFFNKIILQFQHDPILLKELTQKL